ncbi:MAG TPA: T9SS type A sorting domain-containing protein, partial [Bacteroidota bacterium]|nr:T9SS type A sorting domain-containing protein [Bacteroidota bacterium]
PPSNWVNPYFTGNLPGDPNIGALSVLTTTKVKIAKGTTPSTYVLEQNYPNPFNPTTTIEYSLPARTHVRLEVYDIAGRLVAELVNGVQESGRYAQVWNASNAASGMYFIRLQSDRFTSTRKMLLVK